MIRPLKDRVLLEPIKEGETVKNGLIVPTSRSLSYRKFWVVAIGDGIDSLQIGDCVLMDGYSGVPVLDGDNEYIIAKEESIMAICEAE